MLGPDVGVRPVEVGLLGREQVQVPLARARRRRPSMRVQAGPPKIDCQPFGGSSPSGSAAGPEPEALRARAIRAPTRAPPGTTGAGRRRGSGRCRRSCGCRARGPRRSAARPRSSVPNDGSIDAVVGDVVARVGHRRRVPRVEPERVDAEVAQVRQRARARRRGRRSRRRSRRRSSGRRPGRRPRRATSAPSATGSSRRRGRAAGLDRLSRRRRAPDGFTRRQSHIRQSNARARRNLARS